MTVDFEIDRKRMAVLIMDFQNEIIQRIPEDQRDALIERARSVLAAARSAEVPIIYVVVRFRDGYPEASPNNKVFSDIRSTGRLKEGSAGAEIHPMLTPHAGDIIVTKRRFGAFSTTDLETILRANNINTLVMLGISTSGVVLSTVRWAADMDYALIVLSDSCADANEEVHRFLIDKIFPRQATIVTTQEFLNKLGT
jgi:nicotinamidase-related amidase